MFIPKLLAGFGMVFGFNFYFLVVRLIAGITFFDANTDISVLEHSFLFFWVKPEMLNGIAQILFTLVAVMLLQSIPGMISKILGSDDPISIGARTMDEMSESIHQMSDMVSGYALKDSLAKGVDTLKSFVPTKDKFVGFLPKKAQKAIKQHDKAKEMKKQEKKRGKEQAENSKKAEQMKKDLKAKGYSDEIAEKRAKEYEQNLNKAYDEAQDRRTKFKQGQQDADKKAFDKREDKRGKIKEAVKEHERKDAGKAENAKAKQAKANAKAKKKEAKKK